MSYNYKIPQINLYDAYNAFVAGETDKGRELIKKYYENGMKNPRASLYEAATEVETLNKWADEWDKVTIKQMPKKDFEKRQQLHRETINEILYPIDENVKAAKDKLYKAFRSMYKNDELRSMAEFVINSKFMSGLTLLRKFAKRIFK